MDEAHQKDRPSHERDLYSTDADAGSKENQSLDTILTENKVVDHPSRPEGHPDLLATAYPDSTKTVSTEGQQEEDSRCNLHIGEEGDWAEYHETWGEQRRRNPLMYSRRTPKGYTTIEEAHKAFTELMQISTMDARETRPRQTDIFGQSSVDATVVDPWKVPISVDTAIDTEEIETMRRKLKKLTRMLNTQQLNLLERQAEIVQLRMSIVNAMMEFEARSNLIRRESSRIIQEEEGTVMNKVMNSSSSSTDSVDGSQSSSQSLNASWPQSASGFLGPDSLHTIEEDQEESSDSSDTIEGVDSTFTSQPTRLLPPAMPLMDRWDMSLNASPWENPIHLEPNGGRILPSTRRQFFPAEILLAPATNTTTTSEEEQQSDAAAKSWKNMSESTIVGSRPSDASPERWTKGSPDVSTVPTKDAILEALKLVTEQAKED